MHIPAAAYCIAIAIALDQLCYAIQHGIMPPAQPAHISHRKGLYAYTHCCLGCYTKTRTGAILGAMLICLFFYL